MFGNQNYRMLIFMNVDTLLNSKTDVNMVLTHFQLNTTCFSKQTLLTLVIYYVNIS